MSRLDDTDPTLAYYETDAARITADYETVDLSATLERIVLRLPPAAGILELGAGSGRDAAFLLGRGFEVTVLDGSEAMAERAASLHPELAGRIRVHRLPAPLPFPDEAFDAVLSLATLMHLHRASIADVLTECRRVLRPGGTLAVSVPTERPGLDEAGRDDRGRHFTVMDAVAWQRLIRGADFEPVEEWSSADAAGRGGIRWWTAVWQAK
ncbi:MAG: methyltransferase domain-containing protein [Spirochaetes bacterium]|jgi:SAM-dependent methyltransferase|nr:methyltransferase domain-containing protein [Spirochaetota bacterium]